MCIGVSKQLYILQMYKPRTDLADTCSPQGNVHTLDLIAVPMPTEWLVDTVQVHWLSMHLSAGSTLALTLQHSHTKMN